MAIPPVTISCARQVFVSSQRVVDSRAQRALLATVAAANRAGFPIRVAIISSDYDMGSITALWRRPGALRPVPWARVGVGVQGAAARGDAERVWLQQAGQPMRREHQVLANVAIGPGEAGLLGAAQTAVRRLAGADGVAVVSTTGTAGASRAFPRRQQRVGRDGRGGRGRARRTGHRPARADASTDQADEQSGHARRRADRRGSPPEIGGRGAGICGALCGGGGRADPRPARHAARRRNLGCATRVSHHAAAGQLAGGSPAGAEFCVARSERPRGVRRGVSRPAGDRDLRRSAVPEPVPA